MAVRVPLLVQIEYHPRSPIAESVAEYLQSALYDDPAVPGLRIPTCFTPDDGLGEPPEPLIATEADRVVVVLLADDHLAARARYPTARGRTWGDYVVRLRQLCDSSSGLRFMPVELTEHGWPIDSRLDDLSFLRAWSIDNGEERRKLIARRLVHLLIRRLRPHPADEDAPAVKIFLSHTKLDMEHEPHVVKSLLAHLTATQPERAWFDSGDIAVGSRFARELERGVTDAALLIVVTDSYSSRAWCRREVLLAKRYQRPVVVVDAVQDREIRSFPYAGNSPVIRWRGAPEDVVDLLLRECLKHAYAEENLRQRKRPDDDVLPAGPELLTLVHRERGRSVLYPDPPLGPEELAILDATGVRVATPLERHAREHDLRDRSLIVALSVSKSEDLARFGLRQGHLDALFLELSRYLLLAGIRLAYGGHLRTGGYTVRLADLLHDPVVEHLRGDLPSDAPSTAELITYLSWPMPTMIEEEARLGPLVETRRCERPPDVDETLDPAFVEALVEEMPSDSAVRRFAWARGLTVMRQRQTEETAARIVIGGGLCPGAYRGRMPGVLEEALLSIRAGRPIYLVGAFGGAARLVVDALEGTERAELTSDFHEKAVDLQQLRELYEKHQQVWDTYEDIAGFLRERGMSGLRNGLTVDENRELAETRSAERIVELVLHGLTQSYPSEGGRRSR